MNDKVFCVDCVHYTGTYSGFDIKKRCRKNLDYVTGQPLLCSLFNNNGDCEDYEPKNKECGKDEV